MSSPVVASSAPELWPSLPPSIPWDDHLLPHSSSHHSFAKAFNHCLASRSPSIPQTYASLIHASHQPLLALLQQKSLQEAHLSKSPSPVSSSSDHKETSGGMLSSPACANSSINTGMASGDSVPIDTASLLQEKREVPENHVVSALRAAAMSVKGAGEVHELTSDSHVAAKAAPSALSAHTSVGSVGTKVNKRRARASSKAPITIHPVDTSNFREMVQKLTGIPVSAAPPNVFQFVNNQDASVVKPHPTRPAQSSQGLPTLDTSAYLLVDGGSTGVHPSKLLQNLPNYSFMKPFPQQLDSGFRTDLATEQRLPRTGTHANQNRLPLGANPDLKPSHPALVGSFNNFGASLPRLWDATERSQECFTDKVSGKGVYNGGVDLYNVRQPSSFENLMTGNERLDYERAFGSFSVDSWISADSAIPNKTEMARSS